MSICLPSCLQTLGDSISFLLVMLPGVWCATACQLLFGWGAVQGGQRGMTHGSGAPCTCRAPLIHLH